MRRENKKIWQTTVFDLKGTCIKNGKLQVLTLLSEFKLALTIRYSSKPPCVLYEDSLMCFWAVGAGGQLKSHDSENGGNDTSLHVV